MSDPLEGVRVRGLLADGAVRLLLVEARGLAEHTRRIHGLGPDAALLAAESVVAASLLAAHVKGEERITLQIQGSAPRSSVYVDVTAEGHLRARVTPADLRLAEGGTLTGVLVAIKHIGRTELYRGITEVAGCTLEQALAEHLGSSAQVDAVLRIGVRVDDAGTVLQAGGLLIERLPEERDQPSIGPEAFAERFAWVQQTDPAQLLTQLAFGSVGEESLMVLERSALQWQCRCSRERIAATLRALGPEAVQEMIDEDDGAEVRCNFCESVYTFDAEALRALQAADA